MRQVKACNQTVSQIYVLASQRFPQPSCNRVRCNFKAVRKCLWETSSRYSLHCLAPPCEKLDRLSCYDLRLPYSFFLLLVLICTFVDVKANWLMGMQIFSSTSVFGSVRSSLGNNRRRCKQLNQRCGVCQRGRGREKGGCWEPRQTSSIPELCTHISASVSSRVSSADAKAWIKGSPLLIPWLPFISLQLCGLLFISTACFLPSYRPVNNFLSFPLY